MPEKQTSSNYNEALLDSLFGTVEEIEAENQRRQRIYPEFRHDRVDALNERPSATETLRRKIATKMVELFSRDLEGCQND